MEQQEEHASQSFYSELKRFLPALYFVLKFVGLYVVGNIAYGLMVEHYDPKPDPVTRAIAVQTAALLNHTGFPSETKDNPAQPNVILSWSGRNILAIYEGCNGLNVMIVFMSFILAMGPYTNRMIWFVSSGLLLIHVMNLARIYGLFMVAVYLPEQFYFVHKYLFTAFLYVIVFITWIIWIRLDRRMLHDDGVKN